MSKPKFLMTEAEKEWALRQEYWQQQLPPQYTPVKKSRFDYTKDFQDRPARKQVDQPRPLQQEDISGFYNIWYHRIYGENSWDKNKRERAETRCNVEKDSGKTRGDTNSSHICIYFCKGRCSQGPNCNFLHRRPMEHDEKRSNSMADIFGRERHRSEREDMGGVGCFFHENRTLYVGSLKNVGTLEDMEEIVRKHFEEWGELEYVRVIKSKGIAFVHYKLRCCAEFAKEAMSDQSLGHSEILNVRWAHDDPNPVVQAQKDSKASEQVLDSMINKWGDSTLWEYNTEHYRQTGELPSAGNLEYPNTDNQYSQSDYYSSYYAMYNNPAYPFHYFQDYSGVSDSYQPYTTPYKTVADLQAEREREEPESDQSQKRRKLGTEEQNTTKTTTTKVEELNHHEPNIEASQEKSETTQTTDNENQTEKD